MNLSNSLFWREQLEKNSRNLRPYLILSVLCIILYLPGIAALPVTDRDEPMYAQASRQMVEDGEYIKINFQKTPRNKKPSGIYWLQTLSVKAFGEKDEIWPYRVPSFLGVLFSILLLFWGGSALIKPEKALLASALLACSTMLVLVGHVAITDAALLAAITGSMAALARIFSHNLKNSSLPPIRYALIFWICAGLGILIKVPFALLMTIGIAIAIRIKYKSLSNLRGLRIWWGLPLCLVIVAPWFIAINLATDWQWLQESLGHDFAGKLTSAHEGHGGFPGLYLLSLLAGFWPGIIFLAPALAFTFRRRSGVDFFLLGWIIPLWLILEFVPTKLPHYLLPVYPALALLVAEYIMSPEKLPTNKFARILSFALRWLGVLAPVGLLGFLTLFMMYLSGRTFIPMLIPGIAAIIYTYFAIKYLLKHSRLKLILTSVLLMLVAIPVTLEWGVSTVDEAWLSREIARGYKECVKELPSRPYLSPRLISLGFHMPSLVFQTDRRTLPSDDVRFCVNEFINDDNSLIIVSQEHIQKFLEVMHSKNAPAIPVKEIYGYNYDIKDVGDFETQIIYAHPDMAEIIMKGYGNR